MSYPQPSAELYTVAGFEFFRLFTPLSSPGDIYESAVGSLAIAVGPDSDIANVNVAYFDAQVPTFMQNVVISTGRAFIGRTDAQPAASYAPAGRPGVILFWSDDIYDPNFRPSAADPGDTVLFVTPKLDVIQYFQPVNSLGPERNDITHVFQNYDIDAGTLYIVVPYYGRKYAFVEFTNRDSLLPNDFGISTVNYAITDNGGGNPYHQETVIRAAAAVAAGATVTDIVTATADGMFDALVFSISQPGPAPLRIIMSDRMP